MTDYWQPTTGNYLRVLSEPHSIPRSAREQVARLAEKHRFFHWYLEFPDVFARGGFDVVLGNPPWERIKLQEQEFFASRDPEIAEAPNKAARARLIRELPSRNPALAAEFAAALRAAEGESKFARRSGRFPLAGRGDINTYALFAEAAANLVSETGRVGIVVQSGIATDDTNKVFLTDLITGNTLRSLYDFENRAALFPDVDRRMKFCLLTLGRGDRAARFCFFAQVPEHLDDERRVFELSAEDFALLNPNTRTCPVFRTRADAELTKAIYRRVPVLVREARDDQPEENPWGVNFLAMFHMANDSHLFSTAADFPGGVPDDYLPLYEAKMMHQFDHRWATYEGVTGDDLRKGLARELTDADKRDPCRTVQPRYWVPREEVEARLAGHGERGWLMGFRDIAKPTDERTAIFGVVPRVGVGHKIPLLFLGNPDARSASAIYANMNSLALDYVARNKLGGSSMGYFVVKQLPVLPPDRYCEADLDFIVARVLELTYTAWDLKPFAEDVWREMSPAAKEWIVASGRWSATDNWRPDTDDCPPPFVWDPDRRPVLRAELDAYYAHLYGLNRKQLRYILDPHGLSAKELEDILDPWEDPTCSGPHLLPAEPALDFPGETFRVLKEKEERLYGEYRTRRLVLEAWHRLFG